MISKWKCNNNRCGHVCTDEEILLPLKLGLEQMERDSENQ
jgi:hypothetical protein